MAITRKTTGLDNHFRGLVARLDAELAERDGEDTIFYAQFNGLEQLNRAIVCYINGKAVGCGAFKVFDANSVEVKRMYVLPEYRGKGVASKVLASLESWARDLGHARCVLETGKRQPEAIALYQKQGYTMISNYPPYEIMDNSVCFEKWL
jgi:putative acetyltransferase